MTKNNTNMSEYQTISQAAESTGIGYKTISRWVKEGRVPYLQVGNRRMVSRQGLLDALAAMQVKAGEAIG